MMYSIHTLHPEATVSCCPYLPDKPHCCWKSGMRRKKESETALSYFYWFSGWLKARQVAFHWVGVSPEASRNLEPSPDYRFWLKVFYDHVKANTSKISKTWIQLIIRKFNFRGFSESLILKFSLQYRHKWHKKRFCLVNNGSHIGTTISYTPGGGTWASKQLLSNHQEHLRNKLK